jgi:hypothetical protein
MAIGVTVMVVIAVPVTVALPALPVIPVAFTVAPAAVDMLPIKLKRPVLNQGTRLLSCFSFLTHASMEVR